MKKKNLTERDEAAVEHRELDLAGNGGDAVARIKMTLPGRFLRRPGRASAPVMMMVPPVRVGMGTGGGRGGTGPIRTDAAQPEDTAAGRLRSQRRHFLRKQIVRYCVRYTSGYISFFILMSDSA